MTYYANGDWIMTAEEMRRIDADRYVVRDGRGRYRVMIRDVQGNWREAALLPTKSAADEYLRSSVAR